MSLPPLGSIFWLVPIELSYHWDLLTFMHFVTLYQVALHGLICFWTALHIFGDMNNIWFLVLPSIENSEYICSCFSSTHSPTHPTPEGKEKENDDLEGTCELLQRCSYCKSHVIITTKRFYFSYADVQTETQKG